MKQSIRLKFTCVFAAIVAAVITGIIFMNTFFLNEYYTVTRQNTMTEIAEQLYDTWENDYEHRGDVLVAIKEAYNVSFLSIDTSWRTTYTSMPVEDAAKLANRLQNYVFASEAEHEKEVRFEISYDAMKKSRYLECWGILPDNSLFIMSLPLESVSESVAVFNQFLLRVGVTISLVGLLAVYLVTRKVTKPIQVLSEISEKMSRLDFNARYRGKEKDEIGQLGRNINVMSETLEKTISELKTANLNLEKDIEEKVQIDEMRKEFLANVSHELKTPIALIQGYAEGLKDGISDDPESREFYCDVIIDEAAKMNQMVKKLLTLNQLEFGNESVELERFNLDEMIRGVINSAGILIQQKEAVIDYKASPYYVWGDEFKVEEVLTNYISNALNHLDGEKKIHVYIEEKHDKYRIHVENTGKNIPEDELDKVWIKFYKVDKARNREYGGSGIGLSIVKAIMESLQQKYGVYNVEHGVNFWFELEKA